MMGPTLILSNQGKRKQAADWCLKAPAGTVVEFREPAKQRSLEQNDRFHAMCTDVANQILWKDVFGRPMRMSMESWKRFFLAMWARAEGRGTLVVPNEDGDGFYDLNVKSSKLKVREMTDCMELIAAFGAQRGVKFRDEPAEPADTRHKEKA